MEAQEKYTVMARSQRAVQRGKDGSEKNLLGTSCTDAGLQRSGVTIQTPKHDKVCRQVVTLAEAVKLEKAALNTQIHGRHTLQILTLCYTYIPVLL